MKKFLLVAADDNDDAELFGEADQSSCSKILVNILAGIANNESVELKTVW